VEGLTLLIHIKRQTGFDTDDSLSLGRLYARVRDKIPWLVQRFYERIVGDPEALPLITGGEAQVERLKQTLHRWIESGLLGPHDDAFLENRARIGRMHVRIDMPQHLMVTAMNGLRRDLRRVIEDQLEGSDERVIEERRRSSLALDRWLDLELALMLETYREDSQAKLARSERLATLGELASSIAHDLRNPLGVIQSSLYLLRRQYGPECGAERHLDKIDRQVQRCNQIINDLLELVKGRPLNRSHFDPLPLLQEVIEAAGFPQGIHLSPEPAPASAEAPTADPGEIRIREDEEDREGLLFARRLREGGPSKEGRAEILLDLAPGLSLYGDPGLLRQALLNLFENARNALAGQPGLVLCRLRATPLAPSREGSESADGDGGQAPVGTIRQELLLELFDNGPGIPPAILSSVFEPLVTGHSRGTGLGLALVRAIVERHGGSVLAQNRSAGGAHFSLRLPLPELSP